MSMTDEERHQAVQEVMGLFKTENVEFLKKLAAKKFAKGFCAISDATGSSSNESRGNVESGGMGLMISGIPSQHPSDSKHARFSTDPATAASKTGASESKITSHSTAKTSAAVATASSNHSKPSKPVVASAASPSTVVSKSNRDRFHLNGCKVVIRQEAIVEFQRALQESSLLTVEWGLDDLKLHQIAEYSVDLLASITFVRLEADDEVSLDSFPSHPASAADNNMSDTLSGDSTAAKDAEATTRQGRPDNSRGNSNDDTADNESNRGDIEQEQQREEFGESVSGYTFTEISEVIYHHRIGLA
jgi:hypothetical protein